MTNEEKILNLLQEMQSDMQHMQSDITDMKTEITGMKTEITGMKTEITGMKTEITGMKTEITGMKTEITDIKASQNRLEKKLDDVYNQTADLTEFRTEANTKLDKISDDIEFLKHEEYQTKQDIFKLKKNLEVIK